MRARRLLPVIALLFAGAGGALGKSVDFRWVGGSQMGEINASVRNKSGDSVYFYCTAGQEKKQAGYYLELNKSFKKGSFSTVQFVIDGNSYTIQNDAETTEGNPAGTYNALYSIIIAIKGSKSKSFSIEIPEKNVIITFSTLSSRQYLGSENNKTIIDRCS